MKKFALPIYSLAKTEDKSIPVSMKKSVYVLLAVVLLTALGYFFLFYLPLSLPLLWIKLMQLGSFALLGVTSIMLVKKIFFFKSFKEKLFFPLQLFFLLFAGLFLLQYFLGTADLFMALASSSAFIFPHILFLSWDSFKLAVQPVKKVWHTTKLSQGAAVFLYGMSLRIKLPVKRLDKQKKQYSIKAPLSMKLGEFFDHFITMQNSKWRQNIEVSEDTGQDFGWLFYEETVKGLSKRSLDPDLNLVDNGVKENATIIAIRVATAKREEVNSEGNSVLI